MFFITVAPKAHVVKVGVSRSGISSVISPLTMFKPAFASSRKKTVSSSLVAPLISGYVVAGAYAASTLSRSKVMRGGQCWTCQRILRQAPVSRSLAGASSETSERVKSASIASSTSYSFIASTCSPATVSPGARQRMPESCHSPAVIST